METFTAGAETIAVWSVVQWSSVPSDLRFEPEYHQPKYLSLERTLSGIGCDRLENLALNINSGPFGSNLLKSLYVDDGVIVLRPFNIEHATVEDENLVFISQADCEAQGLPLYKARDVAFARVGDIRCGIIPDFGKPITISPNIIVAQLDERTINPYFLATFMNTALGFSQLERAIKVVAQPTITVETVKSLSIPRISQREQLEVERMLRASFQMRQDAKALYTEAEALLLAELGLDDFGLSHRSTYTQDFSQAWAAGRLDAEYFHPEKWEILSQLEAIPGRMVGDCFQSVRELLSPPERDTGEMVYNYDLTDALRFFLDDEVELVPTYELGSTKKRFQRGDVVVSRLRSYLKEIAVVATPDDASCVGSSEFIVLRAKNKRVTPELLLVYLRCPPVQTVLKWCQDGSNHPRFREDELLTFKFPDRILGVQEEIKRLIRNGIQASRDARRLLEDAKRRVEEMVLGK